MEKVPTRLWCSVHFQPHVALGHLCYDDKGSWAFALFVHDGATSPLDCSWALRGQAGQEFTQQATHTAHQGCWTVPRARATLAVSPDSEDSTIWPPWGSRRQERE